MLTLIDKAVKMCGSSKELARRLGVAPSVISMLKSERTISPANAALLAEIAGEDAREAAIQAVIENAKGSRHEGVLREILGKGLAVGVAVLLVFSYNDEPTSKLINANSSSFSLTIYTSWNVLNAFLCSVAQTLKLLFSPQVGPLFAIEGFALSQK